MADRLTKLQDAMRDGTAHLVDIVRLDHVPLAKVRYRVCLTGSVCTMTVTDDEARHLSVLDEQHTCATRAERETMSYDISMTVDPGPGVFSTHLDLGNMTSNVAPLWRKACPDTDGLAGIHGKTGKDVAAHLRAGLEDMKAKRAEYEPLVLGGGEWGTYDSAVDYLTRATEAAETHPQAVFGVSR